MPEWWDSFVLAFVSLFIVIDPVGNLAFILSLSEGMTTRERRRVIHIAAVTAVGVGLVFLFFGQFILNVMGISVGSFAIAGGFILLALSIRYLMTGNMVEVHRQEMIAVVPIGTPLLAGPATVATLLLLATQFELLLVLAAFVINMFLAWIAFLLGNYIVRLVGRGGLRAISNVFNLLLAAIAVAMIIRGLDLLGIIDIVT